MRRVRVIVDTDAKNEADDQFAIVHVLLTPTFDVLEPRIAERDLTVVWIGGGPYPEGGIEYNLSNDIAAANAVFASRLWVSQPVYVMLGVNYAEMEAKVAPYGELKQGT